MQFDKLFLKAKYFSYHFKQYFFIVIGLSILCSSAQSASAVWYRYHDRNGIVSLSSSVTSEHIKYGYEKLNSQMQVIEKVAPQRSDYSKKTQSKRQQREKQQTSDQQFRAAYGNSEFAEKKQREALNLIRQQISFQENQLSQIESRHEPTDAPSIQQIKSNIEILNRNYQRTENEYQNIISRLKHMGK